MIETDSDSKTNTDSHPMIKTDFQSNVNTDLYPMAIQQSAYGDNFRLGYFCPKLGL